VHVDIEGLNYTGKADLKKSIFDLHSKAIINKINVIYDKEPYLMNKKIDADLITKINLNSLSFLFEQNNLKINQFVVDLKGSFDFLKEGYKMDLMVKSKENSIEDILSGFPPKFISWLDKTNVKGYADLSFELKGDYIASKNIAPDLNFDLKIKNGFINYDNSPFPVSNLDTDLSIKLPSLEPEQLNVDVKNLALNINQDFLKAKFKSQGLSSPFVDADINADIDIGKVK
jgi:AsmA protein